MVALSTVLQLTNNGSYKSIGCGPWYCPKFKRIMSPPRYYTSRPRYFLLVYQKTNKIQTYFAKYSKQGLSMAK